MPIKLEVSVTSTPEFSSQTLSSMKPQKVQPPQTLSQTVERGCFPKHSASQWRQTMAWLIHVVEREGVSRMTGWTGGWHWFPQCPGPRMSSPGRRDCPACLTKRDAQDRPGTPSPPINPVHACSLRSARHPDPSVPKAPISSALL